MSEFKVPIRFKLMGYTIEVEIKELLSENHDAVGASLFRRNKIEIQDTDMLDRPKCKAEKTFIHEVLHWVLYVMGEDELKDNERFVDIMAGLLHQVLTTMEYDKKKSGG